jgi:UDP-N-acetylglucosamine enolpyruvyl transferase
MRAAVAVVLKAQRLEQVKAAVATERMTIQPQGQEQLTQAAVVAREARAAATVEVAAMVDQA